MNPEVKEQWIDALTSGEYEQGTSRLVTHLQSGQPEQWCCLGVLADLHAKVGGCKRAGDVFVGPGIDHQDLPPELKGYEADGEAMPLAQTMIWAGLSSEDGSFLAELNDEGASFNAIQKYVRRHL